MEVYDTEYKTFDVGRVNQGYKHGFFLQDNDFMP